MRPLHLTIALPLALLLMPPVPAHAAATKKVFHERLTISPSGPLASGTGYDLRFALTNDSLSPQAFASAQILVPSGYTLGALSTDVTGFTAVSSTGGLLVTSVGPTPTGIQPGATLTVTASITTPTAGSCNAVWSTRVKQSNDFSGTGNDFQPADAAPTTTAGTPHLAFTTQPHLTQWDKAMSPATVVTALDPCGSTNVAFTGAVGLADSGQLATGSPVNAVAGVATFSALTFHDFGISDTLTASASGYDPVTSDPFDVVQSLVPCAANKACTTGKLSDKAGTTLVNITAASGGTADVLTATVKGVPAVLGTCGQPTNVTPEPALGALFTFNVATRSKTVTMTLPRTYVNLIPNNGTPFMDVCLDVPAPAAFRDKSGNTVTTGLLHDCTTAFPPPCVSDRRKNAGDELLTMVLPPGDPRGSWY